ncbi:MAG: MATE family efflux transporter, partial [Candidatus Rifleibacteriota bacterium]
TDSLFLGILIIAFGVAVGIATWKPLFFLLGARDKVLEYIGDYMQIWHFGMVFVVVPMIGNNTLRATGDTKIPGLIMILGAVVNFVLDPILIFGLGPLPAFGIKGAAAATLIGRGCTFAASIYVLAVRERLLSIEIPGMKDVWRSWRDILYVGIPDAGARMIIPFGQGIITRIVAGYGAGAIAGYGVATRIEFFSLAALSALSSVIGPFVGQNIGAGQKERVKESFKISLKFSIFLGISLWFVYFFFAERISGLFNQDPETILSASLYLKIVSLVFAAHGFFMVVNAGLNVLKYPFMASALCVLELFGLAIPFSILGSHYWGLTGIFFAISASYLIIGVTAWLAINRALEPAKSNKF